MLLYIFYDNLFFSLRRFIIVLDRFSNPDLLPFILTPPVYKILEFFPTPLLGSPNFLALESIEPLTLKVLTRAHKEKLSSRFFVELLEKFAAYYMKTKMAFLMIILDALGIKGYADLATNERGLSDGPVPVFKFH